jgi:hypothetical protein
VGDSRLALDFLENMLRKSGFTTARLIAMIALPASATVRIIAGMAVSNVEERS